MLTSSIPQPLLQERSSAWRDWVKQWRAALAAEGLPEAERKALQDAANPVLVPRNHVMVDIIGRAEAGDYEPLHK